MEIKTKSGHTILIDDEDWDKVGCFKWNIRQFANSKTFYAEGYGNKKQILMHRLILNAPKGQWVDHIDGNGLNNTRSNLRFCTRSQNLANRIKTNIEKTSKYKGVCLRKGTWVAQVTHQCKVYYLGYFLTEIEAALAYNKAALELHGEFARLNVV